MFGSKLTLPIKIKQRNYDQKLYTELLAYGLHPVVAKIFASRVLDPGNWEKIIEPKLHLIQHPHLMQDMQKAADRVASAIINREIIGIETDHDCDGQTSHAILYYNLRYHFSYPQQLIRSYIGHRLHEGYGLSEKLARRILADSIKPNLLITADNGSSDEPRIKLLKDHGIEVIITDHHQIPVSGLPVSAYACLNPTRHDCNYDPYIAGCMVAWLLMTATRIALIERGYLKPDAPKLVDTLDYVAVGTVADCVSFAKSFTNRAVVAYGLQLINRQIKPCWRVLTKLSDNVNAEYLAFKIAPLLNSDGRLASALGSVTFLLSENTTEAEECLAQLIAQNHERREIQKHLVKDSVELVTTQFVASESSICIYLPNGHAGVHGIVASKVKDQFGRPTAIFSPKLGEPELITGSLRGIEGFHVREALQYVDERQPGILTAFGGHSGAGGATLRVEHFAAFKQCFEEACRVQLAGQELYPTLLVDSALPSDLIGLNFLEQLKQLEPFGREFEAPIFTSKAIIKKLKTFGDGSHIKFVLDIEDRLFDAIWFNAKEPEKDLAFDYKIGDKVKLVFGLTENKFNNKISCQIQVLALQVI